MNNKHQYLFIINPVAGKGKALSSLYKIKEFLFRKKVEHHIEISEFPGHIVNLVEKLSKNFTHLISVGGDGTLNEVINGINPESNLSLGVLPLGTGNDFARNLNLDKNIDKNLSLIFNSTTVKNFDIGNAKIKEDNREINFRFINSLGIGFDALVAKLNQRSKRLNGIVSYIFAVIVGLMNYQPLDVELKSDSKQINGKKLLITIGNGQTSGGGFYLTPNAKIDDNLLDICVIDHMAKLKILRKLPLAVMNKLESAKEAIFFNSDKINIKLKRPYYVHADGEIISERASEINVTILKNKLKIISN
ncbi:diacylglycerol/lipid kinase family protein [Melioribacter sp. OK-6-Me]|uniref:diacylglycerol/lipid kinase family protein n=1 Tax=unclassified Melioribacter TaxID=2627329 RepID=UPI003ED92C85